MTQNHMSQKNSVLSDIASDEKLSRNTLAYFRERVRNERYNYVMTKFREAEALGLTKAKLAHRIDKKPDHLSHLLGSPGNWTSDTETDLLIGICREEPIPSSLPILNRTPRNRTMADGLNVNREYASNTQTITLQIKQNDGNVYSRSPVVKSLSSFIEMRAALGLGAPGKGRSRYVPA